ncbi:uncharacterized protein [Battus philenor]|uniref:uncharacterized protein n=1 Tax=Battus philenor TaxID=42288 RepID=UPI0035CEAEF8
MRILLICVLLQHALAQVGFGTSYLRNSRLCHQWNCLNKRLGLPDALPSREQSAAALATLLPDDWREAGKVALDVCYGNRTRRYTNTCPGQALLHCVVDNLIANCPDDKWLKEDGCAPVSSLASFNYMFSQSRYANLKKYITLDRRPAWFLQHYFSSKCCKLPELFNATVLSECGFESMLVYHMHSEQIDAHLMFDRIPVSSNNHRTVVSHAKPVGNDKLTAVESVKIADIGTEENEAVNDPLDCCDMRDFISPEWRSECGFQLSWNKEERLVIAPGPSATTESPKHGNKFDVKIVPLTCEQEKCIFEKLRIVSSSGTVDTLAFSRMLDNITRDGKWVHAKARVDTKCLSKPIVGYEFDCEINKVLACTFDVLTENCPDTKKEHPCKHSSGLQNDFICQISSSKFRPRDRRQFCSVPDFVDKKVMEECGVEAVTKLEYVNVSTPPKQSWPEGTKCKEETAPATCIMKKMDVLNKYGFIDFFKTQDRLRDFCQGVWYPMRSTYSAAFSSVPLYREHCSSQQKLLNVLDTMLATCPISKRSKGANCKKMFSELSSTLPGYRQRISNETLEELLRRFQHVFLPSQVPHLRTTARVVNNPRFNFGIFDAQDEPPVRVIDVKPTPLPLSERPLVLLPVYKRMKNYTRPYNNDGIWRSSV